MSLDEMALREQILTAQLGASLGAVDHPEALVWDLLGISLFPGQQVIDTVDGGILEVVGGGTETVNHDQAGA
jgi:hypothetical protein